MEFDSDQPNTVSSYVNYPNTKPFVNTDWAPSYVQQVPVQYQPASKAFPESNRDCKNLYYYNLSTIFFNQFSTSYDIL